MGSHVLLRQSNNKRGGEQSRRLATRQLTIPQCSQRVLQEILELCTDRFENDVFVGKMFYFSKGKYGCIFNNRAEGERLILAMLSYRFVQAKPKPTKNTGLNCRSTSKLAILAPATSGLPVLLMLCVTHTREKTVSQQQLDNRYFQ